MARQPFRFAPCLAQEDHYLYEERGDTIATLSLAFDFFPPFGECQGPLGPLHTGTAALCLSFAFDIRWECSPCVERLAKHTNAHHRVPSRIFGSIGSQSRSRSAVG
jgi:hypothetical protein